MNKVLLLSLISIALCAVSLDLETFREQMLEKHNYYRSLHQAGNLVRDSLLESLAQSNSERLVTLGYLEHTDFNYNGEYMGETLYSGGFSDTFGYDAVNLWYSEESLYDYSNPGFSNDVGHFTQIVWVNSKKLGCGFACDSNNYCYVTCHYYPGGNYIGEFAAYVLPKSGTTTDVTTSDETTSGDETTEDESDDVTTSDNNTNEDSTSEDTTQTVSSDTNEELETFREKALAKHNYYRALHQAGNLVRDSELERIAQSASEYMIQTRSWYFTDELYNNEYIGQNTFMSYEVPPNAEGIVTMWYDEVSNYDYNNPGYNSEAGCFTQVVWKNSQKIGCGSACSDGECYGCCVYYPSGNYQGEFETNVLPKN